MVEVLDMLRHMKAWPTPKILEERSARLQSTLDEILTSERSEPDSGEVTGEFGTTVHDAYGVQAADVADVEVGGE